MCGFLVHQDQVECGHRRLSCVSSTRAESLPSYSLERTRVGLGASAATVAGNAGTLAWANASYGQGATISGVFGSHPGTMALSSMVNSTFTVFLRERYVNGMNGNQLAAFLFHEALHGYGQGSGMFDQDLKDAFGISQSDPSSRISDYIQKHCFPKKKK